MQKYEGAVMIGKEKCKILKEIRKEIAHYKAKIIYRKSAQIRAIR